MTRPRLLDLFCGAGGASAGYAAAGWDVTGVDLDPAALSRYPFRAVRADAMQAIAGGIELDAFDAIHASPPCQAYSVTRHSHKLPHSESLEDVLPALADWGERTGRPWVVENVPGSPIRGALVLCGTEFGLSAVDSAGRTVRLQRHRLFASNVHLWGAGGCHCAAYRGRSIVGVYGGGAFDNTGGKARGGRTADTSTARTLLGVPWMTHTQMTQCVPPAYTRHIGQQLLEAWAA
jgi:DNA (cytosine-5)-methyltransferase 1